MKRIIITPLFSRNILIKLNEFIIQLSTNKLRNSTSNWFSYTNCCGILARKKNTIWLFKPVYTKNSIWLKFIRHLNSLCMKVTRAITNHTLTREYCLRFFPKENFSCSYGQYSIEIRHYILYKCRRYNNYWNLNRESFNYFITFLEFPWVWSRSFFLS